MLISPVKLFCYTVTYGIKHQRLPQNKLNLYITVFFKILL